jgi:uncharacterized protein (TIGR02145 family)
MAGLSPTTLYYVRAYATTSAGTAYGSQVSFTTTAVPFICGTNTVSDVDGNVYNTVQIGAQCWTQSNLTVTKYRNGDNIPYVFLDSDWWNTNYAAYAIYNHTGINNIMFGKLYNHWAVRDSRGLCPTNWHVPSDTEWSSLENQLGGSGVAGSSLKSTTTQPTPGGWASPNLGASNSSSFNALPGGVRDQNGTFSGLNNNAYWWSSSNAIGFGAWFRYLEVNDNGIGRYSGSWQYGQSVRCVKD